jgi:uracil phosphoribosyltransferase
LKYAFRVRQQVAEDSPLAGFLGTDHVLVPVPGSATTRDRITVAGQLAAALLNAGLGGGIWNGLRRVCPVAKSATAAPGSRPTVSAHYDSFAIEPAGGAPSRVMLVDDVVTKGRTLLAAAARLQEAFPATEIRAFAMLRTMGLAEGVNHLLEPCVGEIRWRAGDARRTP